MSKMSKSVKDARNAKVNTKENAVTNFMGGTSYTLNPIETLKLVTASSIFGEPQYYRDGEFAAAAGIGAKGGNFCNRAGERPVGQSFQGDIRRQTHLQRSNVGFVDGQRQLHNVHGDDGAQCGGIGAVKA